MFHEISDNCHQVPFSGHVRLIVTDIDGTFLNPDKQITPAVAAAVRETVQRGLPFSFATGRVYTPVRPWVEELGMTAPQILNNGADIIRPADGSRLMHETFDAKTLNWLIEAAIQHRFPPIVFEGPRLFRTVHDDTDRILERNHEYVEILPEQDLRQLQSEKVVLLAYPPRQPELVAFNQELLEQGRQANLSFKAMFSEPGILNINTVNTSKINAVKFLCKFFACTVNDVMAIGDGDNDAEMLAGVGCAVAMGNATPAARAAARFQVADNAHDGIVEAFQFAWNHA